MVAVFGDQVVGIAFVILCKLFHDCSYLCRSHIRFPNQNCFSECEPITLFGLSFEDPSRRMLMCSKCVLNSMNCKQYIFIRILLKVNNQSLDLIGIGKQKRLEISNIEIWNPRFALLFCTFSSNKQSKKENEKKKKETFSDSHFSPNLGSILFEWSQNFPKTKGPNKENVLQNCFPMINQSNSNSNSDLDCTVQGFREPLKKYPKQENYKISYKPCTPEW